MKRLVAQILVLLVLAVVLGLTTNALRSQGIDLGGRDPERFRHPDVEFLALPEAASLLEDVESIGFQVLQNDWTETWPAETELGGQVIEAMPRAVRIRVELKDLGELVRELPLAGSTTAVEATTRGSR